MNLTIDSTVIGNTVRWNYNQQPRFNQNNDPLPSISEVIISVETLQRVLALNRT